MKKIQYKNYKKIFTIITLIMISTINFTGCIQEDLQLDAVEIREYQGERLSSVYDFRDKTINFNIKNYLLAGIAPKFHFESGDLAGYEFEMQGFNDTLNSVTLIPYTDEYTTSLPNNTLNVATGDQYKITDITRYVFRSVFPRIVYLLKTKSLFSHFLHHRY